jgi:hypothetical protein
MNWHISGLEIILPVKRPEKLLEVSILRDLYLWRNFICWEYYPRPQTKEFMALTKEVVLGGISDYSSLFKYLPVEDRKDLDRQLSNLKFGVYLGVLILALVAIAIILSLFRH